MPLRKLREIPRKELIREGRNILYVVLGSLVLAFASACFLEPLEIVSGGLLSIGIILNGVIEPLAGFNVSDIVVAIASILFWLIGLIFIGWKFSARTLLSSLLYPAFFSLFLRTGFIDVVGLSVLVGAGEGEEVRHLIGGLFGGFLTGAGVAISFLGDGSTGGVDIIALLLGKATPIREDIWTFAIDASLVLIGAAVYQDILVALIGILTAFCSAMAIQFIYIRGNSAIIVEVISDKREEIQRWAETELEHGTTIIRARGGYSGVRRDILRVIVNRSELNAFRNKIADIDPKAFVSMTQAQTIHGLGFRPLVNTSKRSKFRGGQVEEDVVNEERPGQRRYHGGLTRETGLIHNEAKNRRKRR